MLVMKTVLHVARLTQTVLWARNPPVHKNQGQKIKRCMTRAHVQAKTLHTIQI